MNSERCKLFDDPLERERERERWVREAEGARETDTNVLLLKRVEGIARDSDRERYREREGEAKRCLNSIINSLALFSLKEGRCKEGGG